MSKEKPLNDLNKDSKISLKQKQENDYKNSKYKSIAIAMILLLIPIVILIIGIFVSKLSIPDAYLTGSIIYVCVIILWVSIRYGAFKTYTVLIKKIFTPFRKKQMGIEEEVNISKREDKTIRGNKTKTEVKESFFGIYISSIIGFCLLISSIFIDVYL
ncbi:MAG: DUF3899 domain-containing protein [Mycoplasma sp.]|nr:DUF3899 domain-containing protein [Mycoplasma sp.]